MANRLAGESSPYLLQHARNPVAWYPWGAEALEKARREDKPIFLSIGYSACHWCHVMEHESFENADIARYLNEHFVSIKVDREERPDLDQIYMHAVQVLTGRGGWPMSTFLTPELQPFYGGTYWPPSSRMGMPGFDQVLAAVVDAWRNRRAQVLQQAQELTQRIQLLDPDVPADAELTPDLLRSAESDLLRSFDRAQGGFGGAPKFPQPMALRLALRLWKRRSNPRLLELVETTLDKMRRGGIYDHLAGGFARYSVDERWLVPHFEKMLYDNALLADAYLDGFLATRNTDYARVVRETLDYVLAYMTDPFGGFHSTEDADSEGEEGKFYLWTPVEVEAVLGPEAGQRFCYVYDVTPAGNFEHRNILNLPKTVEQCAALKGWDLPELERELADSRAKLLAERDRRVRPGKDDKVLVSWNALMIHALARAAGPLDEPRYLAAATRAAEFLLTALRRPDGRLQHSWRGGVAKHDAYLDDYTYLIEALLALYEASFEERWIEEAAAFAERVLGEFRDVAGGFFFVSDSHETLITRPKDVYDNATPSGTAMAATCLVRLGKLTGRTDYVAAAAEALKLALPVMQRAALAAAQSLIALDLWLGPTAEIAIIGDATEEQTARSG